MPHTDEEIRAAEAKLAARLESGDTFEMHDVPELRAIADAAQALEATAALLRERVEIARAHGHSWNRIAIPLGVSRQAARQRYGQPPEHPIVRGENYLAFVAAIESSLAELRLAEHERPGVEIMGRERPVR